jgi:hypothetical protein
MNFLTSSSTIIISFTKSHSSTVHNHPPFTFNCSNFELHKNFGTLRDLHRRKNQRNSEFWNCTWRNKLNFFFFFYQICFFTIKQINKFYIFFTNFWFITTFVQFCFFNFVLFIFTENDLFFSFFKFICFIYVKT